MTGNHLATATATIRASADAVWSALTDPAAIRKYLYGSEVTSQWRVGSPITYRGVYEGAEYVDHGTILDFVPGRLLRSTYFSPVGGKQDIPENYHTITWKLEAEGDQTRVELTQDNNESEDAARRAEQNWTAVLEALGSLLETPE